MDGRRVRSVSCHARRRVRSEGGRPSSPPIEQENPFKKEYYNIPIELENKEPVKTSPSKKLLDKVKNQSLHRNYIEKPSVKVNLRKKHVNHYTEPRMVQSMYVESNKDFSLKYISSIKISRPSLSTTAIPKPYKNVETKNSVSILSKTQTYLQERKRRSQSQPPEKRGKQKFDFLSTSNHLPQPKEKNKGKSSQQDYFQTQIKENECDKIRNVIKRENMGNTIRNSCHNSQNPLLIRKSYTNFENHKTKQKKNFENLIGWNFQKSSEVHISCAFLQTRV